MMDSSHATVSGVIFNGVKNVRAATCYGNYGSNYSDIYDYMKDEEIT